jgi:hypothetical protein
MDLSNQIITIECPNCRFSIEILLKQVMAEEPIICPGCLQDIKLTDEGSSTQHAQRDLNNILGDFDIEF